MVDLIFISNWVVYLIVIFALSYGYLISTDYKYFIANVPWSFFSFLVATMLLIIPMTRTQVSLSTFKIGSFKMPTYVFPDYTTPFWYISLILMAFTVFIVWLKWSKRG